MSIFQAKEWWSCNVGENEEFDHNSICIANIDNEKGSNAEEKIETIQKHFSRQENL